MNFLRSYLAPSIILVILAVVAYPLAESGLTLAADSVTVTTRQQVTAEISLTVVSSALTMSPSISGLTGGTGDASTNISVISNSASGYVVTLQATTSGTSTAAMKGLTKSGVIADYPSATPVTWADGTAGTPSRFGFGITNVLINSRTNNATGYSTTTCTTADSCFAKAPTTTPITIANSTANSTSTGDIYTLKFRAQIPANSNPLVASDWYQATTTITATVQ